MGTTMRDEIVDLKKLVDEQAKDEGLWANAENVVEAYLQQELRKLHAAVEDVYKWEKFYNDQK